MQMDKLYPTTDILLLHLSYYILSCGVNGSVERARTHGCFVSKHNINSGHREGRRNFIEHTESPDDNTQRTRVRFINILPKF